MFIFLNDEKTRKLILKARAEQENARFEFVFNMIASPAFSIDCNTEATYLQHYKELTVLLYSAKLSDKDQSSVDHSFSSYSKTFVVNKPALAWGSAPVNYLNFSFSSDVTLSRPTAELVLLL